MFEDYFPEIADIESGQGLPGVEGAEGIDAIFRSQSPFMELKKALEAGYGTSPETQTGGGSFRIESLESDLKNLIFTDKSTTLFNDLLQSKITVWNTVHEYSTLDDVGEAHTYEEGGLPPYNADQYSRRFELIKYIGAVGRVTNPMMAVRSIVGPRQQEIRAKMLSIKRKANQVSYFGDSSLVNTEFNGVIPAVMKGIDSGLVQPDNIIDLEGHRPSLEMFNEGVERIERVAGYTDNLRVYISPNARKNYKNELLRFKRYFVGGDRKVASADVDAELEGLKSNMLVYDGGEMPMRKDMFLNPPGPPRRNAAGNAFVAVGDKPPATPTVNSVSGASRATSTLPAGTYDYLIVAKNNLGHKSAPATSEGVTVSAGQGVAFDVEDGGSSDGQEATAFEIYRRDASSSDWKDYRFLFQAAANGVFHDDNQVMPDTSYMVLVEWDPERVIRYLQLMDATLFPLANVADRIQWLQRLYGALAVYNPKRVVIFKNAGAKSWIDEETEETLS